MASYLYGLLLSRNAGGLRGDAHGLDRAPLRAVPCGALTALVSDLRRPPDRRSLEDVRAHDSALREVVRAGVTVAASRFGQTFVDDAALRTDVLARGAAAAALLDTCDGCVEMRLLLDARDADDPALAGTAAAESAAARVAPAPPAPPAAAGPGTAYLQRMRQAETPAPRVSLRAALGPMVRDERVEVVPGGGGVVFAHLVAHADEQAWRDAVHGLPALARGTAVGPLPLYSFGAGTEPS